MRGELKLLLGCTKGESRRNGDVVLDIELDGDCDRIFCARWSVRWMTSLEPLPRYGDSSDELVGTFVWCGIDCATAEGS